MNGPLDLGALVRPERYPLASKYDPAWLLEMNMGPNPLWLLENLLDDLDLRPGMTVLDLGRVRARCDVGLPRPGAPAWKSSPRTSGSSPRP